jgi:amidase
LGGIGRAEIHSWSTKFRVASSAKEITIGRLHLDGTDPKIDQAVDDALSRAQFRVIPLGKIFLVEWDQAKKGGNTLAAAGSVVKNIDILLG